MEKDREMRKKESTKDDKREEDRKRKAGTEEQKERERERERQTNTREHLTEAMLPCVLNFNQQGSHELVYACDFI